MDSADGTGSGNLFELLRGLVVSFWQAARDTWDDWCEDFEEERL